MTHATLGAIPNYIKHAWVDTGFQKRAMEEGGAEDEKLLTTKMCCIHATFFSLFMKFRGTPRPPPAGSRIQEFPIMGACYYEFFHTTEYQPRIAKPQPDWTEGCVLANGKGPTSLGR